MAENESVNVPASEDDEVMPVGEAQLIILMRLYDVGMALLAANYPERANVVFGAHSEGRIIGPLPSISLDEE